MLTPTQARVIDPILTTQSRGYQHPESVGHLIFPTASVSVRGGKRIEFNKESFKLYNTARAPGAATKRIDFGYQGVAYSLEQHSLEGKVPFEIMQEAGRVPGIDMGARAVRVVQDIMSLRKEYLQGTAARLAANYAGTNKVTLAGVNQWSDAGSNPKGDVNTAKEAIRANIGRYPNTMILGPKVFMDVSEHAAIKDQFKYTSADSITTEMLARYFNVEKVAIGKSIYADDNDAFVDIWGKDAVLAYVPMGQDGNMEVPSYGYTYQLDGTPYVETPYDERNAKSWFYPVTDEFSAELVGAEAGYLIQNATA
ncbi:MAG: major capsid protein [Rhodospirillales bacterium]|nr:major capsid protein [Rhodospirillales bacterium]